MSITDPGFRRERDAFCTRWGDRIRQRWDLPIVPISFMAEAPPKVYKRDRPFYDGSMQFYLRWRLESLATWDLPVPTRADYLGCSFYDSTSFREAGVMIFVPYYLVRDRSLTLYDVAEQQQLLHLTEHLQDWHGVHSKYLGFDRYALMFQLYVVLELARRRRYEDRLRGDITKLDQAFTRYRKGMDLSSLEIAESVDSIKKLRLEMQRRLRHHE